MHRWPYLDFHGPAQSITIIVFDVTRNDTFEDVKYWMEGVRYKCEEDVIVAVVANKCDKMDECAVNMDEVKEFVAKERNTFLYKVSAATGEGIREMFEEVGMCRFTV